MPGNNDNNEFDFLPPAEPPPAFAQERGVLPPAGANILLQHHDVPA